MKFKVPTLQVGTKRLNPEFINPMSTILNPRPLYNSRLPAPLRSEDHKKWIRTFPCAVCGTTFRVEAAHTGVRGLSQIADDRTVIPLCFKHHDRRQPYSIHSLGPVKFQEKFGVDIPLLVERLNQRPRIRVYGSLYVASIEGREWQLLPVSDGFERSLKAAIAITKEAKREWFLDWIAGRRSR